MADSLFDFTFADVLSRGGAFPGDVRSAGDSMGAIASLRWIGAEEEGRAVARLRMHGFAGKRRVGLTVAAFLDPLFEADLVIVPEFRLSFYYRWGCMDFCAANLMPAIYALSRAKRCDSSIGEWELLAAAAAVCAVYGHLGRIDYEAPSGGKAVELVADGFGHGI